MGDCLPSRIIGVVVLVAATQAAAAPPAPAPHVDPALFQELSWRLIGPFRGGRVLAVSGVPGEPEHFYFGSVNGGVWETNDAGRTWQPIFDAQPIGSIGALALAPSNPNVHLRRHAAKRTCAPTSPRATACTSPSTAGKTWTHIGLARHRSRSRAILVHPTRSRTSSSSPRSAIRTARTPSAASSARTTAARAGRSVLGKDDDTGAIDLAFEPGNPDVIYAALWQTRRTPWNVYPPSNGPGSGLYKSTDGGDTWKQLTGNGLPGQRSGASASPSRRSRAAARLRDRRRRPKRRRPVPLGRRRRDLDARQRRRAHLGPRLVLRRRRRRAEKRRRRLRAATSTSIAPTTAGKTFVPIKGAPGGDDYHELWIDPERSRAPHPRRRPGRDRLASTAGKTWSSWYNQPTAQFYHVITDNRFPYWVYGAQQDSGAAGVPSRTDDHRRHHHAASSAKSPPAARATYIAPDPQGPARSSTAAASTSSTCAPADAVDRSRRSRIPRSYRATWTLPLVFSRRDPSVLYFAQPAHVPHRATAASTGRVISPDLTREDPGDPAEPRSPSPRRTSRGTGRGAA